MDARSNLNRNSGAFVGAVLLIVVGIVALISNLGGGDLVARTVPLALGVGFIVAYAMVRQYGFLVPGGILTGLGAGLVVAGWLGAGDAGPYAAIGLGAGFLLIYAIDVLVSRHSRRWWPVIPGGLLVVLGAGTTTTNDTVIRVLQVWSPLVLIAIGVVILLAFVRRPAP